MHNDFKAWADMPVVDNFRRKKAHAVRRVFVGAFRLPEEVVDGLLGAKELYKCRGRARVRTRPDGRIVTRRKNQLAVRFVDAEGTVWLSRTKVGPHMVGEIVHAPNGKYRVHMWSLANEGTYQPAAAIIAADKSVGIGTDRTDEQYETASAADMSAAYEELMGGPPILPPLPAAPTA
jgi:hypothetical protein